MMLSKETDQWLNNTLISLKRTYSKDEYVAALLKQLSEKNIEIGKLKSEVQHLTNELGENFTSKQKRAIKQAAMIECYKEEAYVKIKKENTLLKKDIDRYRAANSELISKNLYLTIESAKKI